MLKLKGVRAGFESSFASEQFYFGLDNKLLSACFLILTIGLKIPAWQDPHEAI